MFSLHEHLASIFQAICMHLSGFAFQGSALAGYLFYAAMAIRFSFAFSLLDRGFLLFLYTYDMTHIPTIRKFSKNIQKLNMALAFVFLVPLDLS